MQALCSIIRAIQQWRVFRKTLQGFLQGRTRGKERRNRLAVCWMTHRLKHKTSWLKVRALLGNWRIICWQLFLYSNSTLTEITVWQEQDLVSLDKQKRRAWRQGVQLLKLQVYLLLQQMERWTSPLLPKSSTTIGEGLPTILPPRQNRAQKYTT